LTPEPALANASAMLAPTPLAAAVTTTRALGIAFFADHRASYRLHSRLRDSRLIMTPKARDSRPGRIGAIQQFNGVDDLGAQAGGLCSSS